MKIAKTKVVFLDRDGVINRKATEHDYIKKVEEFILLDGVATAVRLLNQHGYKIIIVTNQRGIARGMMTEQDLKAIHQKMQNDLKIENAHIDAIYYCPHDFSANCNCRKPKIGMLLQAVLEFDIDKLNSFMVGDSVSDIEAGISFGITPVFIGTSKVEKVLCANNLLSAVNDIILI